MGLTWFGGSAGGCHLGAEMLVTLPLGTPPESAHGRCVAHRIIALTLPSVSVALGSLGRPHAVFTAPWCTQVHSAHLLDNLGEDSNIRN